MNDMTTISVPERQYRDGHVIETRVADGDSRVRVSFSSEAPVARHFGLEILGHRQGEVRTEWIGSGRAPLLVDHARGIDDQVGRVEKVEITGGRGVAVVRFGKSRRALDILERVRDGELSAVSVGYRVHEMAPEGEGAGGVPIYRVTDWEPMEISLVTLPADTSVGVGRDAGEQHRNVPIRGARAMSTESTTATPPHKGTQDGAATLKAERQRVAEIMAVGRTFGCLDAAQAAIDDGRSVEWFKGHVLDLQDEGSARQPRSGSRFASPSVLAGGGDQQRYSLGKAVRALTDSKLWPEAGYEREVSQELGRQMGRSSEGIFIPSDALSTRTTLTTGNAGSLVGTEHLGGAFIDELKPQVAVMGLGATVLRNLSKSVSIPRKTAGSSFEWVAEDSAPTEGTPTFDSVSLAPHQLSALLSASRKMIVQSDPAIEDLMRRDLMAELAIGVDTAAINGAGTATEPEGILNTTGIGSVAAGDPDGGALTWANTVDLATQVKVSNAGVGSLGYLTNAAVIGAAMTTEKSASTGKFILDDDVERLAGHRLAMSNIVPSNLTKGSGTGLSALIFGNWADLLIGEFGAMELLVDPYSNADTGRVRIAVHSFWDIRLRHPQSFAAMEDINTA